MNWEAAEWTRSPLGERRGVKGGGGGHLEITVRDRSEAAQTALSYL